MSLKTKVYFIYNTEIGEYLYRGVSKSPRVYFCINQAKAQIKQELQYPWWRRNIKQTGLVSPSFNDAMAFEVHEFELDYKGKVKV